MARSNILTVRRDFPPVTVQVREPEFRLLNSVRFLDVSALAKVARADVELGTVESACCRHTVYATIRKGMVIGLRTQPCTKENQTVVTPELKKLVTAALKRVRAKRRSAPKIPIPVVKFFRSETIGLLIKTIVCVRICCFGWCFDCCRQVGPGDHPVFCGKVVVTPGAPFPQPPM
jgi:hypothetical protein